MRKFVCPKCQADVLTLAKEVAHRCHFNRNRMTEWEYIGEADARTGNLKPSKG